MYLKKYHIHFVGIGGIGMSGIAKLLLELGYTVSGSDISISRNTKLLESLNGTIFVGHSKEHIYGANLVVVSSAISKNNVEVKAARAAKINVISRAEMLAELMRQKYSIAVSGTHGKTSTTALIAILLKEAKLDPTVVVGGILGEVDSNAFIGEGDFIVAEADESDGSFLQYSPTIAVVTNIDEDHLDFYQDINAIKQIFYKFICKISFYGIAVLCLDDTGIRELIPKISQKTITYGTDSDADLRATDITFKGMKSQFNITYLGTKYGEIILNIPGMHNVYNALAAIAVGLQLEIPFGIVKIAMKNATGVKRRMELKGEVNGVTIVDDYGHHPTEIIATLSSANKSWPDKRKIIVFQPHRYTRTKTLFHKFANSFHKTNILIILPIYGAGEKSTKSLNSKDLCIAIQKAGHPNVLFAKNFELCLELLKSILTSGDILLTMGAGNVYQVGEAYLRSLGLYATKVN